MNVEPLGLKYATFGWNVIEIDGHDMGEILGAFDAATAHRGNPTMILANTIKGKGVSFMENQASWHGTAPNWEQFDKAMAELATPAVPQERMERMLSRAKEEAENAAATARNLVPMAAHNYWWNARDTMKVEMDSTRMAKKMGFNYSKTQEGATMTILECSSCHAQVPLERYLHEPLVPEDESCVECESKSLDGCATCRLWWMNANPEFRFLCRERREVAVPS